MTALDEITKDEFKTAAKVTRAFLADLSEEEAKRPGWHPMSYGSAIRFASKLAAMFDEFPGR